MHPRRQVLLHEKYRGIRGFFQAGVGDPDLAGIILTGGREPDAETVQKAEEEGIPLLVSRLFTFELVGRLYQAGISGMSPC